MASRYVWNAAAGSGSGADFTNAYTADATGITASAAGDTFYFGSDHTEALSGTTTHKGTSDAPDILVTVNRGTGALETMEAGGGAFTSASATTINFRGGMETHGLYFKPGGGYSSTSAANLALTTTNDRQVHNNLSVELPNANNCRITGGAGALLEIVNLKVVNCAANAGFSFGGATILRGAGQGVMWPKAMTGGIMGATNGFTVFDGVDLSNQTSGSRLFVSNQTAVTQEVVLQNCKVHSALSFAASAGRCQRVDVINCTDESGNVLNERHRYEGDLTINRTISRTGGAADSTGSFSWKVVTTAKALRHMPFETFDVEFDVPSGNVGVSTTVAVHIVTDNVTLTDAECHLLLGGAVTSSQSILTFTNDGPTSILATPANQATSTETWTTTGLATPVYQKLEVTFTPARAGPHKGRVRIGKASTTLFICPEPVAA